MKHLLQTRCGADPIALYCLMRLKKRIHTSCTCYSKCWMRGILLTIPAEKSISTMQLLSSHQTSEARILGLEKILDVHIRNQRIMIRSLATSYSMRENYLPPNL